MTLRLYDTLSREKREFKPLRKDRVTLYVCGPTVYDYAHIGNARPAVVFDVLHRLLRREYGAEHVIYARNVTDVDDKINAKAAKEGVPIGEITARYEAAYLADMAALNVLPPTVAPHVTDHMEAITRQIGALVERGAAYAAEGHVLFDVGAYPAYGALSKRSLDDMIAGARVEVAPYKRNAHDFVLWKPSKPGEPEWPSPWGPGRPGWHIECSAMIEEVLGPFPIDIHGGGIDLVFPHHENEIAQGVCAHGHDGPEAYARYWMHNGFLTIEADKMSKSVGNVLLLHDLVKTVPGEVVRWALLSAHYRQPLDWTQSLLDQSRKSLDRLYGVIQRSGHIAARWLHAEESEWRDPTQPLLDDINTPATFARLRAYADELEALMNKQGDAAQAAAADAKARLLQLASLLGVLQQDPDAWFEGGADEDLKARVEALLEQRTAARAAKDWPEADRIRAELDALGVVVMDGPQGATWRMKGAG
ncbi:cysteine--tRNA ligase [Brevundimonas sp. 2R-24]|uniref:Cysteine--tRNA ligase n=1 Tax=Peiella sedimenti TaxID=3061083 RepID=A0ABT8SM10_9CAUL|nr:cysteine--tRNA ligase [Caulobacteraceae bacterium XZ-24]